MNTSVGYGCSSDRVAHFGLGNDSSVKVIEIDWPSGTKQRMQNVQADRLIVVEEGENQAK